MSELNNRLAPFIANGTITDHHGKFIEAIASFATLNLAENGKFPLTAMFEVTQNGRTAMGILPYQAMPIEDKGFFMEVVRYYGDINNAEQVAIISEIWSASMKSVDEAETYRGRLGEHADAVEKLMIISANDKEDVITISFTMKRDERGNLTSIDLEDVRSENANHLRGVLVKMKHTDEDRNHADYEHIKNHYAGMMGMTEVPIDGERGNYLN